MTVVDTAAEEFIVAELERLRPGDGVLGEEGAHESSATGVSWVVDPIDGTVNFLYDIPHYAVSIAAAVDGEVMAGAVINVATGDLYSAAKGEGATMTTASGSVTSLKVTDIQDPALALVGTGFSYDATRRAQQVAILQRLLPKVRDIRRKGSAALDLCYLAAGQLDAYYEHGIHPWDWAAGALIASEAGAVVHVPALSTSGDAFSPVYAYGQGLSGSMEPVLEKAGAMRALNNLR